MNLEIFRLALYPLGIIPPILFGARFFIQWIQSEKKGESVTSKLFWNISCVANIIMCIHAFIQLQYIVYLLQSLNFIIAWRNLNLMSPNPATTRKTVFVLTATALSASALFLMQGRWFCMRSPLGCNSNIGFVWHLFGFFGILLFASRFWIQWWLAERRKASCFTPSFWWISLVGALLSLAYFIKLRDPINVFGYSLGLIPYIRNLMLYPRESADMFILAGETSGDVLGKELVKSLRNLNPEMSIVGVGGKGMREAGVKILYPMLHIMGFSAVIMSLPKLYFYFRKIKKHILKTSPKFVILIDYPDFNMLLAKSLRKKGFKGKVIHYVCPSVWAWRSGRIDKLANSLDCLLSILPFEAHYFKNTSLSVSYVGHPLVKTINSYAYDKDYKLSDDKPILALFPGSREQEIDLNLPLQWAVAKKLSHIYKPVVSVARAELRNKISRHVNADTCMVEQERRYDLMKQAHIALATSGTIVLELGLHSLPTVVTYKLSTFNYLLGRYLFRIRLPFYTLVNIICKKRVFPEFIHKYISQDAVTEALINLDRDRSECTLWCGRLKDELSTLNASEEAASIILGRKGL